MPASNPRSRSSAPMIPTSSSDSWPTRRSAASDATSGAARRCAEERVRPSQLVRSCFAQKRDELLRGEPAVALGEELFDLAPIGRAVVAQLHRDQAIAP